VLPAHDPPQPQPMEANALTTASPACTIPRKCCERSAYFSPFAGETCVPDTYGFSTGLRSIARPRACIDQLLVPATKRQLNAEVLSAAIERSSSAP
jgi:hypothetical protein